MDIIGTILLVLVIVAAVLGLIIGLCKGFSNVSSWGVEYLLALLCTVLIGGAVKKSVEGATGGIIVLVIGLVSLILFGMTSGTCRAIFRRSRKKKLARGKRKKDTRPSGFMDSVFGGVTLAVKGVVIFGGIAAFVLVAFDVTQLGGLIGLTELYAGQSYLSFKPYLMDGLYLLFILFALKFGYRSGISNFLWSLFMIALVVFAGYAAYNIAYSESMSSFASALAVKLSGMIESLETIMGASEGLADTIARVVIMIGAFLIFIVVVVLIGVFGPKLLYCARNGKTFYAIDGIFGAIFALIVVAGVMLIVGNILQPLVVNSARYEFMSTVASYFEGSSFATYFVNNNLLSLSGMQIFDITEWING